MQGVDGCADVTEDYSGISPDDATHVEPPLAEVPVLREIAPVAVSVLVDSDRPQVPLDSAPVVVGVVFDLVAVGLESSARSRPAVS